MWEWGLKYGSTKEQNVYLIERKYKLPAFYTDYMFNKNNKDTLTIQLKWASTVVYIFNMAAITFSVYIAHRISTALEIANSYVKY